MLRGDRLALARPITRVENRSAGAAASMSAIHPPPGRAHGIGVAPDGKTLWSTSRMNSHVYVYSLPDLRLLGGVPTGTDPDWITFTPDSKLAYVANAVSNTVSFIDMQTLQVVKLIPVGQGPKRNGVIRLAGGL